MKQIKNILLCMMLLITTASFAQTKDEIPAQDITEAERIIDKYTGKAVQGFENVIENITPTAVEGFEMAVKLQVAMGIGEIIKGFIVFLLLLFMFWIQCKCLKHEDESSNNGWSEALPMALVGGGLLQIIGTIYMIACLYDGVLYLYAPEWFAVKEIINLFN